MQETEQITRARRRVWRTGCSVLLTMLCTVGGAVAAQAHGYIGGGTSDVVGRAALKSNSGLGAVQYEPQSVEGPKGFPGAGPEDGRIASAGVPRFRELDAQTSTRWNKNVVTDDTVSVGWLYTQTHSTAKWHYYLTKQGWDQNSPLRRDELRVVAEFPSDGSRPSNGAPAHHIAIPSDRDGYHILLGVWDIADTGNAFYQVVDLDVKRRGGGGGGQEAPQAPTGLRATQVTDTTADLTWTGAGSAPEKQTYIVERSGPVGGYRQVGEASSTSFADTTLTPSTEYRYRVIARDEAGRLSPASEQLLIVTLPCDDCLPTWDASAAYNPGDVVMHEGHRYQCITGYQGNGDPNWIYAPSLWERLD